MDRLLPAGNPRGKRVFHEFQRLLLDVRERGFIQVANHVRRDAEYPGNLVNLEFARFQKLGLLGIDGDGLIRHAFFEDGDLVGVLRALIDCVPGIADALGIFHDARMLQDASRLRAVLVEGRAVFVAGEAQANGLFRHGDRAVTHEAVKAEAGDMKNILRQKQHRGLFPQGIHIRIRAGVFVIDAPTGIPIHGHPIRHERIEGHDFSTAIPDDLRVSVSPQEQVRHERFPEREGRHFRIRLVMEQRVQRVIQRLFLATRIVVLVEMERQRGDGL